jgi:alkanesulfonate monooxygenase SsuD/methylene tetrahydromethanopterin reductase-like flavin-dependent oxidoreductase (luciferase family)
MGMRAALEFLADERATHRPEADPLDIGTFTEPIHVGETTVDVPDYALVGAPEVIAERLRKYLSLGVHQMQPRFIAGSADEVVEQLHRFGREVWPLVVEG